MKPIRIEIKEVSVKALKSDLLKASVQLTLEFRLNAESLSIRQDLAMLNVMEDLVTVVIESAQTRMDLPEAQPAQQQQPQGAVLEFVSPQEAVETFERLTNH